jgi:DNA-directed RNA polymerase specialized sigma24 family protein
MSNRSLQSSQKYDKQSDCLEKCLQKLSLQERQLIKDYYQGEMGSKLEKRKQLAVRMGVGVKGLRIMVHRIRKKLEECIQDCIAQSEPEEEKK